MLPHGAQKLLGWFGGYGFQATMGFLTTQVGLPYPIALLVILIESIGAIALVLGLAGRVMAAGVAAVMVGAVATVHLANGFFMNWTGAQAGEGFEFHILAIALALVVMLRGSGAASVDRALSA
jgi:putative oxidoreductase